MKYDAILLDADNTLFDFDRAEHAAICEVLDSLHITDATAPDAYRQINAACWRDFERGIITQKQLKLLRFHRLLDLYAPDADAAEAAELFMVALSHKSMLLPGALDAVRKIASARPVAIVTNGIARVQHGRMDASPIAQYVCALIISEEVNAAKPDPALFHRALERLGGILPDRALMIGDSLSSDIAGAMNAGIHTCWYNPNHLLAPQDMVIDHVIDNIGDMAKVALS